MNSANPHIIPEYHRNEPKTARYLGFKDIKSFRKLRFHPVVLFWYEILVVHVLFKKFKFAFELLTENTNANLKKTYGNDANELLRITQDK